MITCTQNTNTITDKKTSGLTYFCKGLLVFLALGYDALQMVVDDLIYPALKGIPYFDRPWYALTTHWGFVILVWCLAIVYFYKWVHKQNERSKMNLRISKEIFKLIPIAICCSLILAIVSSFLFKSELPQVIREYKSFVRDHGNLGILVAGFQNIYYVVESALIIILLGLMQSAGEVWFKNVKIPWGSIGLCLTWGIFHIVQGIPSAIWITFVAGIIGVFYVKTNKNVWASFVFVVLLFFI